MKILGTKFMGHDSTAVILDLEKKELIAQTTERVTRIKHDEYSVLPVLEEFEKKKLLGNIDFVIHSFASFNNVDTCIETKARTYYNIKLEEITRKIFNIKYLKDRLEIGKKNNKFYGIFILFLKLIKFKKLIYIKYFFMNKFTLNTKKNNQKRIKKLINHSLNKYIKNYKLQFINHHLSHAFSTYYFSNFKKEKKTIIFVLDGQGDGEFATLWEFLDGKYKKISSSNILKNKYKIPVSIGHLYSIFTEALGFYPNSDEGKTEALAAYGEYDKILLDKLNNVFKIDKKNKNFNLNLSQWKIVTNNFFLKKQIKKIGDKNFAATIQYWLEELIIKYLYFVLKDEDLSRINLGVSGGVFANVILTMKIRERLKLKSIYVAPFMGDAGSALGGAIFKGYELGYDLSWLSKLYMPYFGLNYDNEIESTLLNNKKNIKFQKKTKDWYIECAGNIYDGKIVALYQGNQEFGPRALGNRSILANPFIKKNRDKINNNIKKRNWFQPFCPSILEEDREVLFKDSFNHKHMATAFYMKKEFCNLIPCGVHVDGTARPQFVEEKDNKDYYGILKEFKKKAGYGIIINTSFNLHGRSMVLKPQDAIDDFLDCNIDYLYIGNYVVSRL